MKKIILAIGVGIIILPQFTSAAWWNPVSWSIFNQFFLTKNSSLKSPPAPGTAKVTASSSEDQSGKITKKPQSPVKNLRLVPSSSFDTTISIDWSKVKKAESSSTLLAGLSSFNRARLTVKGAYDLFDQKKLLMENLLILKLGFLEASLESRIIGHTVYGRIINLPPLPITKAWLPYKNQWIVFGREEIDDNSRSKIPAWDFVQTSANIIGRLTPDQQKKLIAITQNAKLIKITARLAPTSINGTIFDHFLFELDQPGIQKYLQELKDYFKSLAKANSPLASLEPMAFYNKNIGKIKDFSGEVWISQRDQLPYKITINFKLLVDPAKPEEGFWQINSTSFLTDWNKPKIIIAPVESKTIGELSSGS